jgi:hypothetical protein
LDVLAVAGLVDSIPTAPALLIFFSQSVCSEVLVAINAYFLRVFRVSRIANPVRPDFLFHNFAHTHQWY